MSMGVARKGDVCTGHMCFPSRPNIQGSPDSYADGLAKHRVTDAWAIHTCKNNSHASRLRSGSPTVYTNGLAQGRISDPVACGSRVRSGSSTVFAG